MSSQTRTPHKKQVLNSDRLLEKAKALNAGGFQSKRAKFQFRQRPGQIAIQLPLIASIALAALVHMSPEANRRWSKTTEPVVAYCRQHFSEDIDEQSPVVTEMAKTLDGTLSRRVR